MTTLRHLTPDEQATAGIHPSLTNVVLLPDDISTLTFEDFEQFIFPGWKEALPEILRLGRQALEETEQYLIRLFCHRWLALSVLQRTVCLQTPEVEARS